MVAAVLRAFGKPPQFEQFPDPAVAGGGEVLVHVRAAALKPADKQLASGTHYASPRDLPVVCGVDGVGCLDDGTRVFFGGPRSPYGAMAERSVVARSHCFEIPEALDDATAAAVANPGVSAWLTLTWRAKLAPGETVLVLGATGITGKLAVQIAKLLGAGRVIAAGRNERVLNTLRDLGADTTIRLDKPGQDLAEAFAREAGDAGFDVVVDYLWGRPTEALLAAMTRPQFAVAGRETRLVEVGESAGPTISLPAAVLRSTALTILGTAGLAPGQLLVDAFQKVMAHAAKGELHIAVRKVPLAEVEDAWQRDPHGYRMVLIP
jgi:NADPH:quinone reductase-like Zn-dependent oxidoreductase